ncbi:MAG TPA: PAS domain-containing protein [Halothiobacillus sp.]|nr:PAS domain-containing protein [Halothiobacillus sp.]
MSALRFSFGASITTNILRLINVLDKDTPRKITHPSHGAMAMMPRRPYFLSTTDFKGVITQVSQDFITVSGFVKAELIGNSHDRVRHPDMPVAAFKDLWDTIKAGQSWQQIVKNRGKSGDHY